MKSPLKLLLLALALSLPCAALGASSLQATRSSATSARQKVNQVRGQQMALRQQLNALGTRIESLKAGAPKRRSGELDAALKHSQELSFALTGLAQSLAGAEADAARENLSLLNALSAELSSLRAQFDQVPERSRRQALIGQMRALRAEREQVRASLPAASVPALEATRPSDDPEDLLEQADAARDAEDKVRRELQALESRISEAREERAFDRRMNEFLGDESIFDDQDRRLRLRMETVETTTVKDPPPNSENLSGNSGGGFGNAPMAGDAEATRSQGPGVGTPNPPPILGEQTTTVTRSSKASDARPTVGDPKSRGVAGSEDEDLEDLEVQRARLKGLAEELKLRASKLEQKARALE